MAAQERSYGPRVPSGPFSRLLPTAIDPLDSVGLPSKGDTRLNDFKAQESYYGKIVERYFKFCADSGDSRELEKQFASMSMAISAPLKTENSGVSIGVIQKERTNGNGKLKKGQRPSDYSRDASGSAASSKSTAASSNMQQSPSPELTTILHAMRKLRESIVSTSRRDAFAQRAYVFIIRASILVRHLESYHPALLYLLSSIHPHTPLSSPELHEFVSYHILDLACRQRDLEGAHAARWRYGNKDRRVCRVLNAIIHDDWVSFWRIRRAVDGHQRALMGWRVDEMRMHALKCLGRSYFSAEKDFVEQCADMKWEELVTACNVGWVLEGEKVTIRRPKVK